jgi:hypothetical protein
MWVANEFVLELAAEYQEMLPPSERGRRSLLFGASVHPYARNFRERVRWCVEHGAVLLKWIPYSPVLTQQRSTSATLQACAMHLRGVKGGSASKISLIEPTPASSKWQTNPSRNRRAPLLSSG